MQPSLVQNYICNFCDLIYLQPSEAYIHVIARQSSEDLQKFVYP